MTNYSIRLLSTLFLCFSISLSFAQTSLGNLTEDEVKNLLVNKWEIISVEEKGKRTLMPKGPKAFMIFRKDGKFTMGNPGNLPEDGTWLYEHKFGRIKFEFLDGGDYFTILSISSNELLIHCKINVYPQKLVLKRSS